MEFARDQLIAGLIIAVIFFALLRVKKFAILAPLFGVLTIGGAWMVLTAFNWHSGDVSVRNVIGALLLGIVGSLVVSAKGIINTVAGLIGIVVAVVALLGSLPALNWSWITDAFNAFSHVWHHTYGQAKHG